MASYCRCRTRGPDMNEHFDLRAEGPHTPGYTRDVAAATAECLRVLVRATAKDAGGLRHREVLYDVLGALRFTTQRFSQLLGQLGEFLDHLKVASSEVDGDYQTRVSLAEGALTRARDDAATLAAALETAWSVIW